MKNTDLYLTTKPGLEQAGTISRTLRLARGEGKDYGVPACVPADELETVNLGRISTSGGGPTASSANYSSVLDNSGTSTLGDNGWTLTTGGASGNKILFRHLRVLASGGQTSKLVLGKYRFSLGTVANSTAFLGFFNPQADPVGTAPTNGVFLVVTNGAVVLRVRGASGTAADSATLITLTDGATVEIDVKFVNTGTASSSWGEVWVNGTKSLFTAAQMAQLIAMTGSLYHTYHVQTTTAAARTLVVDYAWPCYDR